MTAPVSMTPQRSTILPLAHRQISMPRTWICRPVAGTPMNWPVWVPWKSQFSITVSPASTKSSCRVLRSDRPVTTMRQVWRWPSRPGPWPGRGSWSMHSWATMSSTTSGLPPTNPSCVSRRMRATFSADIGLSLDGGAQGAQGLVGLFEDGVVGGAVDDVQRPAVAGAGAFGGAELGGWVVPTPDQRCRHDDARQLVSGNGAQGEGSHESGESGLQGVRPGALDNVGSEWGPSVAHLGSQGVDVDGTVLVETV